MKEITALAYYLPQFHTIPENDLWWGKSFTEWTNIRESKSYFPWHDIRRPIAPYNEYNLLNPEVLEWQYELAKNHCISGFLMWDYWFGEGKQLLEKPSQLLVNSKIDFKYCFSWANHSWMNKKKNKLLIEQRYLGAPDYKKYFYKNLPHFESENYIRIDQKPVFGIFQPKTIPDLDVFIETFRELAEKEGLPGIYFIAENTREISSYLFDRHLDSAAYFFKQRKKNKLSAIKEKAIKHYGMDFLGPIVRDYKSTITTQGKYTLKENEIPVLFSGWDTTPRHKKSGTIYKGFTPEVFKKNIEQILNQIKKQNHENPMIIIKSWNEWAEGNIMEPDSLFEDELLKIFKAAMQANRKAEPIKETAHA
jgi:hypothetical protein